MNEYLNKPELDKILEESKGKKLTPFMEAVLEYHKNKERDNLPRGRFIAGVRENILIENVSYNDTYNALDIRFKDAGNNINTTRIFKPMTNVEKSMPIKIRVFLQLLNTCHYPKTYNPILIDQEEWRNLLIAVANACNKTEDRICAGVFVVNRNGYVGLRQTYRTNICSMKELRDHGVSAKEFFTINEQYDKFELPELDLEDKSDEVPF